MRRSNSISCGLILFTLLALLLTACSSGPQVMDGEDMVRSYTQISQDEAKKMMEPPEELPDFDQIILIYCRSGKRSKQAAQKLFDMGYINVYEFGGINDWTGEVVTKEPDTDTSQESEPEMQITEEKTDMKLKIGDAEVPVIWEENDSVDALREIVKEKPLTIQMSMYGGFEQVGPIGRDIVSNDQQTTTQAGDIVLYSGDQIVIFYGSNSWAYTRLGHVDLSSKEMEDLLGNGDVMLTLQMGGSR